MVTTMAFLQYYLKSSTKRGWEMSSLLVAIQTVLDQHTGTDYKKGDRWNFNVGEKNARTYFLISTKGLQEEYRDQM
jgi:predicted ATP-grasp superfamily ATP-dependent carboligase